MGNIVERASKIVVGNFSDIKDSPTLNFDVSRSLKPKRKLFFNRIEAVTYKEVEQKYLYTGLDKNAFVSANSLLEFIRGFTSNQNHQPSQEPEYGVGGIIAGISHGPDCERFVLMFDDQQYLIFLDEKNTVIAQFAIKSAEFGNLSKALQSIDHALAEQTL